MEGFYRLEDVIDFYSKGGWPSVSNQSLDIDDKIGTFEITTDETADLVAFLNRSYGHFPFFRKPRPASPPAFRPRREIKAVTAQQ